MEGGARAGRRVEQAVVWAVRNLDGVIGIGIAVVVGLLDIFSNKVAPDVVSGATLLVLASLTYASLAERKRRVTDMREATSGARRAIEDLTMVRSLSGPEVEQALHNARQDTDRWTFRGGTGTYLRAVTLPECVREAQGQRRSLTVKVDIVNPADERVCTAYARFRRTFAHRLDSSGGRWTVERTRKEAYATVLAACWYRQRLDTLDIDVHLSSTVSALRYDLSSSCLIITQDDPRRVNLYVERGRVLYDYYVTELHMYREQAVKLSLRDAPLLSDEPTVDEVRRLFDTLGLALPVTFTDRYVSEIVDKALHAENPYSR
jgi:hypothetical protein